MKREVKPEQLDQLPPDDRRALQSRRDLQKVNWWMGHAGLISRLLRKAFRESAPDSLVELGAGDGTLFLRLANLLSPAWKPGRVVLVDRQGVVTSQTRSRFEALGWPVETVQANVFDWLGRPDPQPFDVCLANLFLHHFTDEQLRRLLSQAAQQMGVLIACEPRRGRLTLGATRLLRLLRCNEVSVHDGKISVRAGFTKSELSALWPRAQGLRGVAAKKWRLIEEPAGLFSHCFMAY